jgi:phosphotransferase system enzyme I (PtsI)
MPSEDEQFEAYRKTIKGLEGRPIVIRTFDLGNDKELHVDDAPGDRRRDNPALGLRSVRLSLAEPKVFLAQLRAILRASKYGKVKILVPMFSHAFQVDQTLAVLEHAKSSLRGEKTAFDEHIEIGGMVEVPAAALAIGMFLRRLDFLSIGTNDLIQYTLAINRGDEQVANLYDPLHPAVLVLLSHIIGSAEKAGVPISMCGEMAGDPAFTRLLLGMGLRQFSMFPARIPAVKQRVKQSDVSALEPIARRIVRLDEPAKIAEQVEKLNALQQ